MRIRSAKELGVLIKQLRRAQGLSQQDLASRIGVSRYWVLHVETGKPTVELGLVLKALNALGAELDVRANALPHPSNVSRLNRVARLPATDIDAVIEEVRQHTRRNDP
jgi:HTH-type transcriptional regulator / antitoxin HipB